MLRSCSDNPSGFLAMNDGNLIFRAPDIDGVVFYRNVGKCWIQFGGPVAAPADRGALLDQFCAAAKQANRQVVAVQVPESDAPIYADRGMVVNQFGMSYAVELADFGLGGKKFVKLRNKIARAGRLGVKTFEAQPEQYAAELAELDRVWLRSKGRFTREMKFMVGEMGGSAQPLRRLFVATLDDRLIGYISYSPVYGSRAGWLHDLSRRVPDAPAGVMESINLYAIDRFREAGVPWLHFGFTPFTGLDPQHGLPTGNRRIDGLFRLLAVKGKALYPSQSQLEYKMKWHPNYLTPDYISYTGKLSARLVYSILKVTNVI
ncbi:MAG TPA: DUF2156 domain-containing protein [Sporichthyaceae bacterium]|nr:DUF2156 domain-containing protein [Sporichthyaceae bacterium]